MAEYRLVLPSMGEGVMEATIIGWAKNEGDDIEEDDIVLEIATDKVDSDVPSPVSGKLIKKLKQVNDICKIGEVFAILEIEKAEEGEKQEKINEDQVQETSISKEEEIITELEQPLETKDITDIVSGKDSFYSPLVRAICKEENISQKELDAIQGSGLGGRVTKDDLFSYLKKRDAVPVSTIENQPTQKEFSAVPVREISGEDEIIEMDRMRKLIANHMVFSKQVSPHVTSFVEADVTNIVSWRDKNKDVFLKKEGEKLTFTPIFVYAIVKAIKDFPMINVSVDGSRIIKKKNINIGMATALPNGNLIVPVIKNADQLSLSGLAKVVNDLAERARNNKLKPEDVTGGTYTITNIGSFGNIAGTPIINQPEVAIMAVGVITKKPAVIETPQGDLIGIRHKMFLSHTYDHRVVDGAMGGIFAKRVCEYLENFNPETPV